MKSLMVFCFLTSDVATNLVRDINSRAHRRIQRYMNDISLDNTTRIKYFKAKKQYFRIKPSMRLYAVSVCHFCVRERFTDFLLRLFRLKFIRILESLHIFNKKPCSNDPVTSYLLSATFLQHLTRSSGYWGFKTLLCKFYHSIDLNCTHDVVR
jgi:hypothetical protein